MKSSLKIRTLRHLTGLDQQQAAEKLQISVADYSKIETGLLKADDRLFEAIIALFHLNYKQFSSWPDEKSKERIRSYLA